MSKLICINKKEFCYVVTIFRDDIKTLYDLIHKTSIEFPDGMYYSNCEISTTKSYIVINKFTSMKIVQTTGYSHILPQHCSSELLIDYNNTPLKINKFTNLKYNWLKFKWDEDKTEIYTEIENGSKVVYYKENDIIEHKIPKNLCVLNYIN